MASSIIDPMAAKPNPWFENFLKKSSSMIEDQIFGAVKKYENDDKVSDDDGMEELEKNHADTEKNLADLLEDDDLIEAPPPPTAEGIVNKISSNLSQLLKGESVKKSQVDDSSDDDFMTRPAPQQKKNKKQKKQKGQVFSLEEFHRAASSSRDADSGSVADSESERVSDQEVVVATEESKDGWSFEIDEEDVNKLLETEVSLNNRDPSEERTDLEDVFRFDSEMREDEEDEDRERKTGEQDKSVSVEDLNDALMEETTDESEAENCVNTVSNDEDKGVTCPSSVAESIKPVSGTSMSSSYASSLESEGSTTNSPNPRNAQNKSKTRRGRRKRNKQRWRMKESQQNIYTP